MVKGGILYKRYDAKQGKTPPHGFIPAQDPDPVTKHWPGWLEVDKNNPMDQWFVEAFTGMEADGTYELVGPKIQGNPEKQEKHKLVSHRGAEQFIDCPRTFGGIREFLLHRDIEGIVFHHPDGRMVKIKKKDFGLSR